MLYCRHTQESRFINLNRWPFCFFFFFFFLDASSSAYRLCWKVKVISDVWSHLKLKAEELKSPAGSRGITCLDRNVHEIDHINTYFKMQRRENTFSFLSTTLLKCEKPLLIATCSPLWSPPSANCTRVKSPHFDTALFSFLKGSCAIRGWRSGLEAGRYI